jgi:hypothetical protein
MIARPGARPQPAALFARLLARANVNPAIPIRLALDALVGRLDFFEPVGRASDGSQERLSARIGLVQRIISLSIGAVTLREGCASNKQLSAMLRWVFAHLRKEKGAAE